MHGAGGLSPAFFVTCISLRIFRRQSPQQSMRLLNLLTSVLFAGLAIHAGFSVATDIGQTPLRAVAEDLGMRRNLTALGVREAARSEAIGSALASCRSVLLEQAKTVILYDLNQANQVADYEGWVEAHAHAQAFLRGAIRCAPMDADAWIRQAMVSRAIAEDAGGLRDKLELAGQLSPFERQQVLARMSLWKRISPHALGVNAELAEADVMAILRYGSDPAVKTLAAGGSVQFRRMVQKGIERLSSERQTIIKPLITASNPQPAS